MVLIGMAIGILLTLYFLGNNKSRNYRKVLTDLFVTGRIRQLAKDKGVCLEDEYRDFKLFSRRDRIKKHSLDESLEEQMQEELIGEDELEFLDHDEKTE